MLTDSLIPFWYGTPWDFNGMTQKPGKGKIACGYFVFTLLRDAGFRLPRIKLSQATSEEAIKFLIQEKNIKRYRNSSIENFVESIQNLGEGLYLVGLDNHIGFYKL